jgi:hypothetical protein
MADDMHARGARQPAAMVWPAGMVEEVHDHSFRYITELRPESLSTN